MTSFIICSVVVILYARFIRSDYVNEHKVPEVKCIKKTKNNAFYFNKSIFKRFHINDFINILHVMDRRYNNGNCSYT